ncbi:MAG: hypothetical protein KI793_21680 [Rivularia sp. (in: Bacteria)]|nr:hypothetical protein [Rivularia sp. MS3]
MPISSILVIIAIVLTLLFHKNRNGGSNRYHPRKLLNFVHRHTADRLINSAKRQHPGKSERCSHRKGNLRLTARTLRT